MGGYAYHVLNRAANRATLFEDDADYEAFERVLVEARERTPIRIACYCVMPNHWHMVLWPRGGDELSEFMRWLTVTHAQRLHAHRQTAGSGPVYQGRFKSFPIQRNEHFLTVCRYVERNALRANLVERAEDWPWCSLWVRRNRRAADRAFLLDPKSWPVSPGRNWLQSVNRPLSKAELESLRTACKRGAPYGNDRWRVTAAERLGLESSLRPRGRPRKEAKV